MRPEGSGSWRSAGQWSEDPDAIDVWRVSLDAPGPCDLSLLSADERARSERLVTPELTGDFVTARAALRRVLAAYVCDDPQKLQFRYAEQGRPSLIGAAGLDFNLSHSGREALIAVLRRARVGVDIERVRERTRLADLSQRCFAEQESRVWSAQSEAGRVALFYRFWTCKEAYLKACGTGLTFPSRRFAIALPDVASSEAAEESWAPRLLHTEMPGDDPERWCFAEIAGIPGYRAALCCDAPPRTLRLWRSA